jgi:cystathionine beta-lyase
VYSKTELLAFANVVEAHGGRVFSDEIHAPITFDGHNHLPYASLSETTAGHTITAVSASKAWNIPGLKCAQLIASNEKDQAALQEFGFMVSHGAGTPGLVANTVAYNEGHEWLEDVLGYINNNRTRLGELLEKHLPGVGYTPPEGSYIAWLDCRGLPDVTGGASWSEFFMTKAGVALTDGALCGEAGVGHVRMMLSAPTHILELIVQRMGDAVAQAQST